MVEKIRTKEAFVVQIQKFEWRWVVLFAALAMGLLSVPYLVGFSAQTSAQRFGGALIGCEDINSYLAKMNQGAHGAWLFTLPYSSEPQQGTPLYLFYLLLGKISGPDFTSRVLTFHLARIFFGFSLLLITYRFLAEFLPQIYQRRLALIISSLGGGLGWLLILSGNGTWFNSLPLEFSSPESFSFMLLLSLPHLLAARCLLLLSLLAFVQKRYVWSGLALLPLAFIQPATVIIAWAVIGVSSMIKLILAKKYSMRIAWEHLWPACLIGLLSAPAVLYLSFLFLTNPILKQWNGQNNIPTPHILHYLSAFGLYLILAVFGLKQLKPARPDLWCLSIGWALLIPVLLNIPIGIQRRLIEGFQIPLIALAVLGLTTVHNSYRRWLIPLTLFLILPSNLLFWTGTIQSALQTTEPVFRVANELSVLDWLNKNAQPGQVVLSAFSTGNVLPVHTPLISFIGHASETIFLADKLLRVTAFYQPDTPANERLRLLSAGRIKYVIFGPHERDLGALDPSNLPYLIERFRQGEYALYEVTP
jgi:hypothetical protein